MNWQFTEEELQMASNHKTLCSKEDREVKIKTNPKVAILTLLNSRIV